MAANFSVQERLMSSDAEPVAPTISHEPYDSIDSSASTGGTSRHHASTATLTEIPQPPSAQELGTANVHPNKSYGFQQGPAWPRSASPVSPVDEVPLTPSPRDSSSSYQGSSLAATPQAALRINTHGQLRTVRVQAPRTEQRTNYRDGSDNAFGNEKGKPGFVGLVRKFTESSSSWGRDLGIHPPEDVPKWQPTFLRIAPLLGIVALFLVLCCMLASLGILVGSDGQEVADWPWSPSVYLAIYSAAIGRMLEFALLQAIPLAWWYKAYRGSTVRGLQRHWESGEGILRALYNVKHEPVLAFAMLFTALVIADGPFLQKASNVKSELRFSPVTLRVAVAPEIPTGFTGNAVDSGVSTTVEINPAFRDFAINSSLVANITGCDRTCRAALRAPGVAITNCSSNSWPLSPQELEYNSSSSWGSGSDADLGPQPLFNVQVHTQLFEDPPFQGPEAVILQIGIANFNNCSGQYTETKCRLVSAVLEYDVDVHNNSVLEFTTPPSEARFIAYANNTFVDRSQVDAPLAIVPIAGYLKNSITANASLTWSNGTGQSYADARGDKNAISTVNMLIKHTINTESCVASYQDPTKTVLDQFNNLMFRAGIEAAKHANMAERLDPGLELSQEATGQDVRRVNVFRSNLKWWSGAALLELLAALAILPVFWGYWKLGLHVTLSPLEIANVFRAPLFTGVNSGSGSNGVVHRMGDVRIQCGISEVRMEESDLHESDDEASTTACLRFGESDEVMQPRVGTRLVE